VPAPTSEPEQPPLIAAPLLATVDRFIVTYLGSSMA